MGEVEAMRAAYRDELGTVGVMWVYGDSLSSARTMCSRRAVDVCRWIVTGPVRSTAAVQELDNRALCHGDLHPGSVMSANADEGLDDSMVTTLSTYYY